jgi:hypothetical protein
MELLQHSEATQNHSAAESSEMHDWHEHFSRWRERGLSQSDYCHQAGLSRHKFKYWRRKLEPATLKKRRTKKRESGFVPLQVRSTPIESGLSLTLPNGIVLRGIDAANVELVGRLVTKL